MGIKKQPVKNAAADDSQDAAAQAADTPPPDAAAAAPETPPAADTPAADSVSPPAPETPPEAPTGDKVGVILEAPKGTTGFSTEGVSYDVDADSLIMAAVHHVEAAIAHGFKVLRDVFEK